jgi:hypothetical protein
MFVGVKKVVTSIFWAVPGFVGICQDLSGFVGLYRDLLRFVGFCRDLL